MTTTTKDATGATVLMVRGPAEMAMILAALADRWVRGKEIRTSTP